MAKNNKKLTRKERSIQSEDTTKKKVVKTVSASRPSSSRAQNSAKTLVFGKENYKLLGLGLLLIAIGMLLMMGGFNENPAEWDEGLIYSFRRTTLAPIFILSGLVVEIFAIFK